MEGSRWFRRLKSEIEKISSHIRLKRIKHGFYRVYWKQAYIGEVFKEMPLIGYDHTENDRRFESKNFYESKEDSAELTRNIKNFVEGYWDSIDRMRTRVYMMRHSKEFYEDAVNGYKEIKIK
jgi:hypothetical protein